MKQLLIAALAAMTLAGCGPVNTDKFVSTAATAGKFEIETSELAVTKSARNDVKQFAQEMITDHKAAADKLNAAVVASGRPAPSATLDADHARRLDQLKALSGDDFDKLYISQQLNAHEEAVDLFSKSGEEGPLKQFAKEMLPTLETHLSHVRGLNATPTT
jgi:putative membrane protein